LQPRFLQKKTNNLSSSISLLFINAYGVRTISSNFLYLFYMLKSKLKRSTRFRLSSAFRQRIYANSLSPALSVE
jgi:hypothetical protein